MLECISLSNEEKIKLKQSNEELTSEAIRFKSSKEGYENKISEMSKEIIELKNNAKLRSYSVNAIAIEIGYKRPDAFTRSFKEVTALTPATYIKKVNKLLENKI